MTKRKNLTKTVRFEVFKRDRFTCQYCGEKAPDVVLRCDHIHPVAEGGTNDIINLVTACFDCNAGKGARLLDDRSAVERQRAQLEAAQERREQLEMMLQWRDEAEGQKNDAVDEIAKRVIERGGGYGPNENGRNNIRRWLKRFTVAEVLAGLDEAFDKHMAFPQKGKPDTAAWEVAFAKIPTYARYQQIAAEKPYMGRLAYIQGILRRRFDDRYGLYLPPLEDIHIRSGVDVAEMEDMAKRAEDWDGYCIWAAKRGVELGNLVPRPEADHE
jgi:hypothetical protein